MKDEAKKLCKQKKKEKEITVNWVEKSGPLKCNFLKARIATDVLNFQKSKPSSVRSFGAGEEFQTNKEISVRCTRGTGTRSKQHDCISKPHPIGRRNQLEQRNEANKEMELSPPNR